MIRSKVKVKVTGLLKLSSENCTFPGLSAKAPFSVLCFGGHHRRGIQGRESVVTSDTEGAKDRDEK